MRWRRPKSREQDLDRELRAHVELEAEEQRDSGLTPEQARYAAQRAFGNTTYVKEEVREMWGWTSFPPVISAIFPSSFPAYPPRYHAVDATARGQGAA